MKKRDNYVLITIIIAILTASVVGWMFTKKNMSVELLESSGNTSELTQSESLANQAWINKNVLGAEKSGIDSKTFKVINEQFAIDAKKVYIARYIDNNEMKFDPQTFEVLSDISNSGGYVKDKNQAASIHMSGGANAVYEMVGVDIETFESIDGIFGKDINRAYFLEKPIVNSDVKSFEPLGNHYGKDRNFIYFGDKKIHGADLKTFTVDIDSVRDENNSYRCFYESICGTACHITAFETGKTRSDYFGIKPTEPVCNQ
ncbi:MAG: hypothetical protein ACD_5C00267G0002 [uncultured bacterium]|nr:MAG: hypothetical protein ACD_5C00267G0002 [uncultured bacterium]